MKKISLNFFVGYLVLVIVAAITSIFGIYIARRLENENTATKQIVSLYPDYDSSLTLHPLVVVENITSSNSNVNDLSTTGIKLEARGYFSRMYLYLEISVDDKPLTDWDSIYVKFNTVPEALIVWLVSHTPPVEPWNKWLVALVVCIILDM
jgi:hypothetical protein